MYSREKISCIVGTKNAEEDLRDCLESVKWADEVIVVDDFSSDRTIEIARQYTDKIFQKKMIGYPEQKDFAVQKTSFCWVLSLDADERVSPELRDEILDALSQPLEVSGFLFHRQNIFLGHEVKYCGWHEVTILRIFNKEKISFNTNLQYLDEFKISGRLGLMKNDLLHYTCRSLNEYFIRTNIWSTLNAKDLTNKGVRITPFNSLFYLFCKPCLIFIRKYFFKFGYLDGFSGFLICSLSAITYFLSYAKVWELQKGSNAES